MSPLSEGAATFFFMLSVSAAQERILKVFAPVDTESVALDQAAGRVLAGRIVARTDLPLFDYSSMDGFALHAADLVGSRTLEVVADIRAGWPSEAQLQPGQAARIMTGAPLPKGAAAVIKLEDTDCNQGNTNIAAPKTVTTSKSLQPGENVRYRGEDLRQGIEVLPAGTRLRAQEIGLLAMLGEAQVMVYRRPRLALLSTGDELVPVAAPLSPGKIHESNAYALATLAVEAGAELIRLGVASDDEDDIRAKLAPALAAKADLIVSSAGVSMGAFDLVKPVIEKDGELDFWKVNMRPGKPLAFGKYRGIPFFGLPGNPVSSMVSFEVFVRPALEKLSGREESARISRKAFLAEALESDGRESYLRAITYQENGRLQVRLTGSQSSGNSLSLVRANALLIVPSGVKSLPANSEVEIWPIA
jgi:molybdopterin molybdotransferase